MTIRHDEDVLMVDDPNANVAYAIEPARHELGLTRVEMVDYHLSTLASSGPALWLNHIDALLDARATFQMELT